MRRCKQIALDLVKCVVEIITLIIMPKPNCYIWIAVLPVCSLIGIIVSGALRRIPVLKYAVGGVLSIGFMMLVGSRLASPYHEVIPMSILGIVAAVRGMVIAENEWVDVSQTYFYTILMVFNLLFSIFAGIVPALQPYQTMTSVIGLAVVVVSLYAMNQLNLLNLVQVQHDRLNAGNMAVPKTMNLYNKSLLGAVYLIVFAVSTVGILIRALKWLAGALVKALSAFFSLLQPEEILGEAGGGGGGDQGSLSDLVGDLPVRNPLWERFEQAIVNAVAVIAVIALTVFLLFMLYKGIRKLIQYLARIRYEHDEYNAGFEEYTDIRGQLFELRDLPAAYAKRLRNWWEEQFEREPGWKELKTVPEKVRALYRRAIYRGAASGYRHRESRTPSEVMAELEGRVKTDRASLETLRQYYELVRYAEREPDAQEVEQLNKKIL